MKNLILLLLIVTLTGCATHAVKNAGRKFENFEEIQGISYDSTYLYVQFIARDRTGETKEALKRWARMPKEGLWKHAKSATDGSTPNTHPAYPESVTYKGVEYEVRLNQLNAEISEDGSYGWEIVLDHSTLKTLTDSVNIQKEAGTWIDPQNSEFGEQESDLFLFTYPNKDPQLVLIDRDQKRALLIWRFAQPHGYSYSPEKFQGIKAVITPLAKTVDIVTLPIIIPVYLLRGPSWN